MTTLASLLMLQLAAQVVSTPTAVEPAFAPIEIVLYSDFLCPFCQRFAAPIRKLQEDGVDGMKVNVRFKHFPLSIHPAAPLVHQAALAAEAQGKFWEMHDLLFTNQAKATRTDLLNYAKQLDLDMARFERDLESDAVKQTIAADLAGGNAAGVTGTPSYTIDGTMYSGTRLLAQLEELIVGEQRRARALAEVPESALTKGPGDAPVMLELFMDLQSPLSAPTLDVVNQLLQRYPADVRLQFRNFPLAFHPQAAFAHEAAMAAARYERFWELTTFILTRQDALREQDVIAHAGSLGIDPERFASALREHRYAPRVSADVTAAVGRGIRGSPSIVVNGKKIDGVPSLQMLADYVEAALRESRPGVAADR
jgi:protein-disulfide isomerase